MSRQDEEQERQMVPKRPRREDSVGSTTPTYNVNGSTHPGYRLDAGHPRGP